LSSQKRLSSDDQASAAPPSQGTTRGAETRSRLVGSVIRCVAIHGLEGTTITRLCEISGLSRGLISFHFDGKDQLLEAALARAIALYEASWDGCVVAPEMTAHERLHRVVDHDLDFAAAEPDILALWWAAWGEARAKEIYRKSSAARDQRFVTDLASMFRDAGLSAAAARRSAVVLNATLLGYWLQLHLGEPGDDLEALRAAGHALIETLLASATNRSMSRARRD
jgi:TetR/AcrR family transcriptional regulator, transcriptional repressor of bet genes